MLYFTPALTEFYPIYFRNVFPMYQDYFESYSCPLKCLLLSAKLLNVDSVLSSKSLLKILNRIRAKIDPCIIHHDVTQHPFTLWTIKYFTIILKDSLLFPRDLPVRWDLCYTLTRLHLNDLKQFLLKLLCRHGYWRKTVLVSCYWLIWLMSSLQYVWELSMESTKQKHSLGNWDRLLFPWPINLYCWREQGKWDYNQITLFLINKSIN